MQETVKMTPSEVLDELVERYPQLGEMKTEIYDAFRVMRDCFQKGGRIYVCGNGGSAADSEHIVGELVKSFRIARPIDKAYAEKLQAIGGALGEEVANALEGGLPAVSLCGHPSLSTAFANDNNPTLTFAQQVSVYGNAGDVLVTISTSGNSKNCVCATVVAKAKDMQVVFFGGGNGGKLKGFADVSLVVPETDTFKVQELHLPIYHCLCAMLEREFF